MNLINIMLNWNFKYNLKIKYQWIINNTVPGPPPPPPVAASMPPPPTKGRTNLLKDIEKGRKLRKVKDSEKNDRSAAFIENKSKIKINKNK